ncbi:MAG: tRNA pseudouridine(13) synthase TruD, partial [Myxococcales bacterium]|nr:tRNA pseudouridine(13) synthase TruD [Myxococcales bacterium]
RDRKRAKFLVSSLQSEWFNQWLGRRITDGLLARYVPGDLLKKEDSGGLFTTDEPHDAETRVADFAVSPTGPMFGAKMRWPLGEALERELSILEDSGTKLETLEVFRRSGEGTRRVARIRPTDVTVAAEGDAVRVGFVLPKGAYATVIMREVLKPEARGRGLYADCATT